jgi:murein L,D-transpeptidase YcbB/YkuD
VEGGLAPPRPSPQALLEAAARAPSLIAELRATLAMNPLYETLRSAYGRQATRLAPAARRTVERNLARLRAIPANPGRRWIMVDAGGARLWMMEGRRVAGSMRVIVGKPNMQTPVMAARLRYAILNPYWNLPPDLVRERAKRVLRQGSAFLAAERLQLLSDWGPRPRVLKPSQVDWAAVASGRQYLRVRQLPGGANVMGAVKFMMPNDLGIYLHDFPDKSLFARTDRHLSSGCVRLEDAPLLARWLFGGNAPRPRGGAAEQEAELPAPVPVYLVYLTAFPAGEGVGIRRDVYDRDRGTVGQRLVEQDRADRIEPPSR